MFNPGKYKLWTDVSRGDRIRARIILSKVDILFLSFSGPMYMGMFQIVEPKEHFNIQFLTPKREINIFRVVGPVNKPGETMMEFQLKHTKKDNSNIYRIFPNADFQTLSLRNPGEN